jgi:hypothetical protein
VSLLDRLDPWATTGVGSLPFDDPDAAAAHAVFAYDLPFCPQLPGLDGDMISEWLGADPARCGWSAERDRERPRAWDAWIAELQKHPPPHRLVKLQVTGPATLACALTRSGTGRSSRREAIALAREVSSWLAANAAPQVVRLQEIGLDPVLVVDEPALGIFGTEGVDDAWDPLRAVAPAWGIHLCCRVPWKLVERAEPDLLSFDLTLEPPGRQALTVLAGLLRKERHVAWGAIRVEHREDETVALQRLENALAGIEADTGRSLISPSCGSGRMSLPREREIVVELFDLATALRDRRSRIASAA